MSDTYTTKPIVPGRKTAYEVIQMLEELGLAVCDDEALIREKFEARRPALLKKLRQPDPKEYAKGERGIESGNALQNQRPDLLQIVYEHFSGLAETALWSAASSGIKILTPELVDSLREKQAIIACRMDGELANQFVERYLEEIGAVVDERLPLVGPLADFSALSQTEGILLSWSPPTRGCDHVEITRALRDGDSVKDETTFQINESPYKDSSARPGLWYRYEARPIKSDVQGPPSADDAVRPADVSGAAIQWKDGAMRLSWKLPGPGVAVHLYRASPNPPHVQLENNNLRCVTPDCVVIFNGSADHFDDANVNEGQQYGYRIVADYGLGLLTEGVTVKAAVPQPPPPPEQLTVIFESGVQDNVLLSWQAPPGNFPLEYLVVRSDGPVSASRVEDGHLMATLAMTSWKDVDIDPGKCYTYTVFSSASGLVSRQGTSAPPIDVLSEVWDLKAISADGCIELSWKNHPSISTCLVRRGHTPPASPQDGEPVSLTGEGHARDVGLQNGIRYHYLVCCVYRPDGAREVCSVGSRISAIPERLPEVVDQINCRPVGLEVVCEFASPSYGQVIVMRCESPLGLAVGHRLSSAEIDRFGDRIPITEGGRAVDAHPDLNRPFYALFTIAGENAIVGGSSAAAVVPEVSELNLVATRSGILLRWVWPVGCRSVRIARREGSWPQGPQDPHAVSHILSHLEYSNAGNKYLDRIEDRPGCYNYVVYAQATTPAGIFHAGGTEPGCRAEIQWGEWMTVSYKVGKAAKSQNTDNEMYIKFQIEKPMADFKGLVLIASQSSPPSTIDDGVELMSWTPTQDRVEGEFEESFSLAPVKRKGWKRFYCKLLTLESMQRHAALIVHPNTCRTFSADGQIDIPTTPPLRVYRSGIPDTVICPNCFEAFELEAMLFDSYGGGQATTAKRSVIAKLSGKPLQPPKDKQGRILSRKLCPFCEEDLPFTAGSQLSLIIGLIGARFSGKSHYIASLIERLENQVGSDMDAALLPVTDRTQQRYREEFYNPLFKNRLELSFTIGTPPPLVYDLTLDGRMWQEKHNRAVTLALYDTAGENLQSPDTARRMLKYLSDASGVIFLVDPLQLPMVYETLPAHLLPDVDPDASPNAIIANVLQLLERGQVLQANEPLTIPVAIVLTKADVLADAGLIEGNRLWSTDLRHIGHFNPVAHEDMSGMVGEYFQRWCPDAYNNIRLRFTRYAFFAASATGCASDQATRRYRYISPWRVEDPLLWLLSELGVIRKD